jgi:hypothetical protein
MTDAQARDTELTAAVQLGWRLAELYARVNDTGDPTRDTLLPAHESLEPADQLELQLRAAAGDARRAGAGPAADRLEALGTAYELGNGLSDTYGRVCRAHREPSCSPRTTWLRVFAPDRIERIKKLLDDLETRLDSRGVAIVRAHLDTWSRELPRRLAAKEAPPLRRVRDGLRRQTVIWRQLIAGDKAPEADLDSHARSEVRLELRRRGDEGVRAAHGEDARARLVRAALGAGDGADRRRGNPDDRRHPAEGGAAEPSAGERRGRAAPEWAGSDRETKRGNEQELTE